MPGDILEDLQILSPLLPFVGAISFHQVREYFNIANQEKPAVQDHLSSIWQKQEEGIQSIFDDDFARFLIKGPVLTIDEAATIDRVNKQRISRIVLRIREETLVTGRLESYLRRLKRVEMYGRKLCELGRLIGIALSIYLIWAVLGGPTILSIGRLFSYSLATLLTIFAGVGVAWIWASILESRIGSILDKQALDRSTT